MTLRFKPEDFKYKNVSGDSADAFAKICAETAQRLFDEWLEKQPKVYSHRLAENDVFTDEPAWDAWSEMKMGFDTHIGRIVDVREIKKEKT